ncbi:helix-turn-helix domain-containing protein [Mesorhizobium sp. M0478]|uniref:helix-turn-helix domain-containing protein n=1 Tax=Mesorhizobium sp. M0478 TaxID=2956947 RepID=UPI00333A783D
MLLTQDEVAKRLRCSPQKVKRLRISGQLAYVPGRPVLIEEADFEKYLEGIKRQAKPANPQKEKTGKPVLEDAGVLARRIWLARRNYQLSKPNRGTHK